MVKYFHALLFISALDACSDESSNGGNARVANDSGAAADGSGTNGSGAFAGTGGDAGSGGTAGGETGGSAGSGGVAGSGASSGGVAGMHCAPGTFYEHPVDTYGLGNMVNCRGDQVFDAGIPISDFFNIRSIKLPSETQPGEPYAFSIVIKTPDITAELWGSNEDCGFGFEKVWEGLLTQGIACVSFVPENAHSHLLMVWRVGGEHEDVTLCPAGACGN